MNQEAMEVLSKSAQENIQLWLDMPKFLECRDELVGLLQQKRWQELEDSFFQQIVFGTGGIRGTTGIGSNRINRATLGSAMQALCEHIISDDSRASTKGVVIACDTRLTSTEFSQYVASVAAANNVKTYIFESFRSTPELSFAVRHLGAAAGVVISASHNPASDNGFKAYWSDGGQITAPHDTAIVERASMIDSIRSSDYEAAVHEGSITIIGKEVDDAYVAAVVSQSHGSARALRIAYSPLHGAGQTNVLPVLRAAGFEDIHLVDEQMIPDGNFPTIEGGKPNPEEIIANDRVVALMLNKNADIAIANDPDADRIGIVVNHNDSVIYLNGNQSAVLTADWLLSQMNAAGTLGSRPYLAKTIVTTEMLSAVAASYGATVYTNMLIGFKYIGQLMTKKERSDETFVMGGEESYGLLIGDYARDKDGAAGALPLAEYAAELKKTKKTLYHRLLELYREHGLYLERLESVYFPGASGFDKMQSMMDKLQIAPPKNVGDSQVTAVINYNTSTKTNYDGSTSVVDCVQGNVITLEFDNDPRCKVTIRPSGTEPKMKLYCQWYEYADSDVQAQYSALDNKLISLSKRLEEVVFA